MSPRNFKKGSDWFVRADLHGATSLRQAYDMNCFVQIKPTSRLRLLSTSKKNVVGF